MHIPVIFEDNNIIAIDKPSGVVVHPFDFSTEETLIDFLLRDYPSIFDINNTVTLQDNRIINLGGIVHKLDRDTSGVMVIAKHQQIFDDLKLQFRNHTLQKNYIALVEGIVKEDNFVIDAPFGRNKKDYKQMVNPSNLRGELRDAITEVKVLKRSKHTTLVELTPKTGRTHQLRAHMSYIEHPIVGDKAYGGNQESGRIMLHAQSLSFSVGETKHNFESEIPEDFMVSV